MKPKVKRTQEDRGMIQICTNFYVNSKHPSNLQIVDVLNWVERHNKYLATGPE